MQHLPAGFHADIPAEVYHADPCQAPSLSSTIARVLLEQSPRHAWHQHPRLNPDYKPDTSPTRPMEIGTVAHKLILGRGRDVRVIEADAYTSKDARQQRADAYASGLAPILRPDLEAAEAIAHAARAAIVGIEDCEGFANGTPELVAIAHDPTGAWLRVMIDMWEDRGDEAIIWDVKTGDQSAAPQGIGRRIANMGYEIQAALYERVVVRLRPELAGRIRFRWAFVENDPPHLCTVAELDNIGLEVGRKKVAAAISLWNRCLATGNWPGYPARVVLAEYPAFAETAWTTREMEDESLREMGIDPFLVRAPWRPEPAPKKLVGAV